MTETALKHRQNPIGFKFLELTGVDEKKPFWKGYVAEYESDYALLGTVYPEGRDDTPYNETKGVYRKFRAGDFLSKKSQSFKYELRDLDENELEGCEGLLDEFIDIHKNSPYKITGRKFGDKPSYYDWDKKHKYPNYELLEEKSWQPNDVHSLDDAEKWLLTNHPDYFMGGGVVQQCPSGDFAMYAVPGVEYEKGTYENSKNRLEYAKNRAKELNARLTEEKLKSRRMPNVPTVSDETEFTPDFD